MGRDILLQLNNTIKCQRESAIARNKHAHIYTTGRWLEDKHTSLSFHLGAVLVLFGWYCWKAAPDFSPPSLYIFSPRYRKHSFVNTTNKLLFVSCLGLGIFFPPFLDQLYRS